MTTREQPSTPTEGICESCDSLADLAHITDEDGHHWLLCPVCI